MKTKNHLLRLLSILCFFFLFAVTANAQYRHYHGRSGYYNRYPVRSYGSVGIGYSRYGYGYSQSYRHYGYGYIAPHFGIRFSVLPYGYYPIYVGPNPYYYYNGDYYRPYGENQYETTAPPLGANVPNLPKDAKVTVVDGQKYYEYDGTFYKEEIDAGNKLSYTVVGTDGVLNTDNNASVQHEDAVGDRVDQLPAESKPIVINKQKYYIAPSGIYYQEVIDGNKIHYEVVGKSSDMQ